MARAVLTVNEINRTGLALPSETVIVAADGTSVPNSSNLFLLAHNTNAVSTAHTLTIAVAKTVDGQSVTARTYTLAATATKLIGPFPSDVYGSTLTIDVDHTELKLTAFHLSS